MKNIKLSLTVFAFFVVSGLLAQELQPKFEEHGDLIKGTYYYEDGSTRQEGTRTAKSTGSGFLLTKTVKRMPLPNTAKESKWGNGFFCQLMA